MKRDSFPPRLVGFLEWTNERLGRKRAAWETGITIFTVHSVKTGGPALAVFTFRPTYADYHR